jgi:hypothetical protein
MHSTHMAIELGLSDLMKWNHTTIHWIIVVVVDRALEQSLTITTLLVLDMHHNILHNFVIVLNLYST